MRWILVVDDDAMVVEALTCVLHQRCAGVEVLGASTVGEAKRLLLEFPVDVVISDYRLPRRTGIDLAMWASRLPVRPRCILITAYPDVRVVRSAAHRGFIEGFLVKPFQAAKIMELLEAMLWGGEGDPQRRRLRHLLDVAVTGSRG